MSHAFIIAHRLKARLRVRIPALKRDSRRLPILVLLLYKHTGVKHVKTVDAIASVTIEVNPDVLPIDTLLPLLERLIANLGQASSDAEKPLGAKMLPEDGQEVQALYFGIQGMSCPSCSAYLELLLQNRPEIVEAQVDYLTAAGWVRGCLEDQVVVDLIQSAGYRAYRLDTIRENHQALRYELAHLKQSRQNLKSALILSLPIALMGLWNIRSRPLLGLQALLTAQTVFRSGRSIFTQGWRRLRQGSADMNSLVALGSGAAYGYSLPALFRPQTHVYFGSAAAIIDFVLLGRYLELSAKTEMLGHIEHLVEQFPQTACVLRDHQEQIVGLADVKKGDLIFVRPGEVIPADGLVVKGLSNVDERSVNGQSRPCIKEQGQSVFAGSVNGSGILQIKVSRAGLDHRLEQQMAMRHQAAVATRALQSRADRYSAVLIPGIFGLSALTLVGGLFKGATVGHALANALAVLMISCPCALGLATPAATTVGYSRAAKRNIYIRHGEAFPVLQHIDTFVFDPAGTLTRNADVISDVINISDFSDAEWIQWAASLEQNAGASRHQALLNYNADESLALLEVSRFVYTPDQGMKANIKGHAVMLGHAAWMRKQRINLEALVETAENLEREGKTVIYMAVDNTLAGLFAFANEVRPEADAVIQYLQQQQIQTLLISGDRVLTVEAIARQFSLTDWQAECDPAKKLKRIRELQQQGHQVAMVGEGMKNAPALQAADVSFSLGHNRDMAILSADFILPDQDVQGVTKMQRISQETLQNIDQNLGLAFVYNAFAIPLAMSGRLSPVIASGAMALSSLSIVFNSLRLINKPVE